MKTILFLTFIELIGILKPTYAAYVPYEVSSGANKQRIERLRVDSVCTSNPCTITSQSGSWVSSVGWNSAGNMTVNFTAGTFSAAPTCIVTGQNPQIYCLSSGGGSATSSAFGVSCIAPPSTAANSNFQLICMGPR